MRIGDKPPSQPGSGDADVFDREGNRVASAAVETRGTAPAPSDGDMVTLGEDLYMILCELLDSVPFSTQVAIATAFQSKPHPKFGELGLDVREAFEAGAAAFDDDLVDDDEGDEDEQPDDDEA